MKIWIASLAAVAVQPLVIALRLAPDYFSSPESFHGMGFFFLSVLVVAAAAVLVLGVPAFLILRKLKCEGWRSLAFVGFVLGALPVMLFWPSYLGGYSASQNWHGKHIQTYIDGFPTTYAWLIYGEDAFYYGLHGLVGALVFYAVWLRLTTRPQRGKA